MPPHQLKIVVYLELEIIGKSSKLGVQALSKLNISALTNTISSSTIQKDAQYKTYADSSWQSTRGVIR